MPFFTCCTQVHRLVPRCLDYLPLFHRNESVFRFLHLSELCQSIQGFVQLNPSSGTESLRIDTGLGISVFSRISRSNSSCVAISLCRSKSCHYCESQNMPVAASSAKPVSVQAPKRLSQLRRPQSPPSGPPRHCCCDAPSGWDTQRIPNPLLIRRSTPF